MGKAATLLPVTPHTLMGNLVPNHLQTTWLGQGFVRGRAAPFLKSTRSQPMGFPGGPVAKSPCSQYRGLGFNPWSGN